MPSRWLCEPVCVCLHLLSSCRASWLISGKGWKKKRNIKDIKFFYLSWNLAAGERRDVFELSCPRKRTTWLILRQEKLCKLMNESTALSLLQKNSQQNPQPSLRNQPGQEKASVDLVLIGQKVSSEKIEAYYRVINRVYYRGEHTACSCSTFLSQSTFFLSYFGSLDLKWIIQSVSLVHVRLHQFDFVWCSGEGKKWWDVTCTLSWVLFVSTRVWWDETSEKPGIKDSHYFVSAYANVLEDYIWEKAFQAPYTFSVWELS